MSTTAAAIRRWRDLCVAAQRRWPHVKPILLSRNYGQTAAMQAGIDAARGGFIATLNGDLQNDPADIPRMVAELIQCDLDLLQAAAARNSAGMPVAGWGR